MELSNLTGSPCQDVFQVTISGHRRRTVNRPIRFRDGVDSSDVTATSSVSTSNGVNLYLIGQILSKQMIFVL